MCSLFEHRTPWLYELNSALNYILYRLLHTGCQWSELAIDPHPAHPEKKRLVIMLVIIIFASGSAMAVGALFEGYIGLLFRWPTTPEEWPQALQQWPGLQSVVLVERERRVLPPEGGPAGAQVVPTVTQHYYLSSLKPAATRLLGAIRAHWGIENRLHWVLDVAFEEDACRVRKDHAAHNLATLRKLSLNLLRQDQEAKCGVKGRRKMAGWDEDYLLRILAGP